MSKKDKLSKEIDILREKRKDWFSVLFALSSAIIMLMYSVLSGERPVYILLLGVIGFVGLVSLSVYYKKLEATLEDKLDDLEKEI